MSFFTSVSSFLQGLGSVLSLVVNLVNKIRRKKEQQDAQKSYNEIEEDPVGEFKNKFGSNSSDDSNGS